MKNVKETELQKANRLAYYWLQQGTLASHKGDDVKAFAYSMKGERYLAKVQKLLNT